MSTEINIRSNDGYQMTIIINQPSKQYQHPLRGYAEHPFAYRVFARVEIHSVTRRLSRPSIRSRSWRISPGVVRRHSWNPFRETVVLGEEELLQEAFFAACNLLRRWHADEMAPDDTRQMESLFHQVHEKIASVKTGGSNQNLHLDSKRFIDHRSEKPERVAAE